MASGGVPCRSPNDLRCSPARRGASKEPNDFLPQQEAAGVLGNWRESIQRGHACQATGKLKNDRTICAGTRKKKSVQARRYSTWKAWEERRESSSWQASLKSRKGSSAPRARQSGNVKKRRFSPLTDRRRSFRLPGFNRVEQRETPQNVETRRAPSACCRKGNPRYRRRTSAEERGVEERTIGESVRREDVDIDKSGKTIPTVRE